METRDGSDDTAHLNNTNGNYNNGTNGNGVNTHHDGVNTTTDKEGRKNILWVKIVSAYVFSSFSSSYISLISLSMLKLILVVAFATAIAAGVLLGKDLSTESKRKVIANLLKASYVLALGK